ncbi:MAG: TlpA family protein disulfide reductase [Phycisphaerae bacterium]
MFSEQRRHTKCGRARHWTTTVFVAVLLVTVATGCSKADEKPAETSAADNSPTGDEAGPAQTQVPIPQPSASDATTTADNTPTSLPAFQIDEDAPTVEQKYPGLASAGLVHAKLTDLSEDVLLRADDMAVTQSDIDAQVADAPEDMREQLRKNAFFLLEQTATQKLLVQEARKANGDGAVEEQSLVQSYFEAMVDELEVTDREVAEFYEDNRDLVGGATLEQVREQIRQYLLQKKQQKLVNRHVRTLAQRTPVAVDAGWVKTHAKLAKDNPVDNARASGKPTFANFGAEGCVPCDRMEPMREEIREEYEGKLNVVFVHVGQDQVLASRYGVQGIPTLVFFDAEGNEVFRHTGYMEREKVEEKLAELGVK